MEKKWEVKYGQTQKYFPLKTNVEETSTSAHNSSTMLFRVFPGTSSAH